MLHHGTIRKYTAALLDLFNGLEIQYEDSAGAVHSRNIPVKYSSIEKSRVLDNYTSEQLLSGNYNVLPRASIAMVQMIKAEQRITNKNVKINTYKQEDHFEYMYNSVPYEFQFQLDIQCRGMNEAAMIVEQLAPKFNPTVNIDIWDAANLNEPTRVPVRLLDIAIESEEYEELSSNIVNVSCGISIMGNLYPPIRSTERVKDFKIYINEAPGDGYFSRKDILGWDVNTDGELKNGTINSITDTTVFAPQVIDIVSIAPVVMGHNELTVIYEDVDNQLDELTFEWVILSGNATIQGDVYNADLTIISAGDIEVQVTISDIYGNYNSFIKTYTV